MHYCLFSLPKKVWTTNFDSNKIFFKEIEAPISGLFFEKAMYFTIFLLYDQKQNNEAL